MTCKRNKNLKNRKGRPLRASLSCFPKPYTSSPKIHSRLTYIVVMFGPGYETLSIRNTTYISLRRVLLIVVAEGIAYGCGYQAAQQVIPYGQCLCFGGFIAWLLTQPQRAGQQHRSCSGGGT